jgi:hypothetical protein
MIQKITLSTWNVCLGSRNKINIIADFIEENKIDLLCLTEAEILEDDNINAYVAGICRNLAFPEMLRQFQKCLGT